MACRGIQSVDRQLSDFLVRADASRLTVNGILDKAAKSAFGQYMTPASVATFMAAMIDLPTGGYIRLLDPGAGTGSLTSAIVDRIVSEGCAKSLSVDAYEIDSVMLPHLSGNIDRCKAALDLAGVKTCFRVHAEDFVLAAAGAIVESGSLWGGERDSYSHCIMNPPYKKIPSASKHARHLEQAGFCVPNLYAAFMALALELLEPGGQMVAIVPRSFCNGLYYKPFREFLLKRASVRAIHLFGSRTSAFKDDNVLQENVIIKLDRGGSQGDVAVSWSTDQSFSDLLGRLIPFERILNPVDPERYINIPVFQSGEHLNYPPKATCSLNDLGIQVSTGPVVDFRNRESLRESHSGETVPLLYPCHFVNGYTEWPKQGGKKPNAIVLNDQTRKWLFPNGYYAVTRRFSSKEEKRRIVAGLLQPELLQGAELIGIENHVNVFHRNRCSLERETALGLVVYLNSTAVDNVFRGFSGHTQVNATDLRMMKYPPLDILGKLGIAAGESGPLGQEQVDAIVARLLA